MQTRTLFLVSVMLFSVASAFAQSNITAQGDCGDNLKWELTDEGVLTVSGEGDMIDVEYDSGYGGYLAPWSDYLSDIKSVVMGTDVTSVGSYAFFYCTALASADLPNVKTIGAYAFYDCSDLNSLNMPNITKIGFWAFSNCGLTSLTISEKVTYIGESAFGACEKLQTVNYNAIDCEFDAMGSISSSAFLGCNNLTELNIGDEVESIPNSIFSNCGIISVDLKNVTTLGSEDGFDFGPFNSCRNLVSVKMPNVTSIGRSTFWGCNALASVDMPKLTSIGISAFSWCGFSSLTLPEGLTNIGENAFNGCENLAFISIPKSVTSIGDYAFSWCTGLDTVKVFKEVPLAMTSTFSDVFYEINPSCVLSVPKLTKSVYEAHPFWGEFANIVERESLIEDYLTFAMELYDEYNVILTIQWGSISGVYAYTIYVYYDAARTELYCIIYLDKDGNFIGADFRSVRESDGEISYTFSGLLTGTTYYYTISATDESEEIMDETSGSFTTPAPSGVVKINIPDCIVYGKNQSVVIENAANQRILIADITGRVLLNQSATSTVEEFYMHNKGIYLVRVGNKSYKVVVK